MGIINPGRRRRKRLQSPKDEGTRRYSAARKWERTSGSSLHRSAPSPPSQKLPPGIRHLVVFAALPRTQVQGTRYLVNQRIPWCSHRLFEWLSTPKSGVFFFFFSAFTKSFQTAFGPLGPFQKTNSPTAAPRAPPPTSQLKLPLSVLAGRRGTACFARTLHRKWCNLGRFSSFPIPFPKLKREKCKESQEYEPSLE